MPSGACQGRTWGCFLVKNEQTPCLCTPLIYFLQEWSYSVRRPLPRDEIIRLWRNRAAFAWRWLKKPCARRRGNQCSRRPSPRWRPDSRDTGCLNPPVTSTSPSRARFFWCRAEPVRSRLLVYSHVKWLGVKDMFGRARYDLPGKMTMVPVDNLVEMV